MAIKKACESAKEVFVIGGSDLYEAILPIADAIYLTIINREFQGDAFFPDIDLNNWSEVEREDINDDPDVAFSYSFLKFEKANQQHQLAKTNKKTMKTVKMAEFNDNFVKATAW